MDKPSPEEIFASLNGMLKEFSREEELIILIRPEALNELLDKVAQGPLSHLPQGPIERIMGYEFKVTTLIDEPYKFVPKKDVMPDPVLKLFRGW